MGLYGPMWWTNLRHWEMVLIYIYIAYNKWEKDSNDQSICIVGVELDCVRAFPMDSLKFKPNFELRPYFFNSN